MRLEFFFMSKINVFKVLKNMSESKFQGSMVGGLIGDCLGAPFESDYWSHNGIQKEKLTKKLFDNNGCLKSKKKYTDDTAMAKLVAISLLQNGKYNPVDMASRFSEEYVKEPFRGYGSGVVSVFEKWQRKKITEENVYIPSNEQFDGSGSFGNGGAMRVSPVALYSKSLDECIKIAHQSAMLTHSNEKGFNGAILQALAVYIVLQHNPTKEFNIEGYIKSVKEEMLKLEKNATKMDDDMEDIQEYTRSPTFTYCTQLDVISELLKQNKDKSYQESVKSVIKKLGHDISAMTAVPAALYSFLHNIDHGFEETLYFAISLGGDTDTIASMACAIAGAYHGLEKIPEDWIQQSESSSDLLQLGKELYDLKR